MEDLIVTRWTSETPTECGLYAVYWGDTKNKYGIADIVQNEEGNKYVFFHKESSYPLNDVDRIGMCWLPIKECPNA